MNYYFGDFQVEDYLEAKELIEMNHEEINPLSWDLKVDVTVYLNDNFKTAVLYDNEKIVGYAVFVIHKHHHYSDKLMAVQDVMYIHPEYRKGITGIKFIKRLESSLKDIGVEGILQSTTVERDLSSLFSYLGYEPTEKLFFKEI